MRAFVIGLALLGGVNAAPCDITDFTAMVGVQGKVGDTPCSGATTADDATCKYEATAGYTTTGEMTYVCGSSSLTTTAAPVVSGCAAGYIQSTYGDATASGTQTVGVCTKCGDGKTSAAKTFQTSTGAETCQAVAACTLPAASAMTNGIVSDAAVGANGCPAAAGTLAAGTKCTYTLDPAYTNVAAATANLLVMSCPITPGTLTAPTIVTGAASALANGAWAKDKSEGCAAGYYQSLDGVKTAVTQPKCAKCDAGKTSSGVAVFQTTAIAKDVTCKYCAANFYQTAGTDTTGAGLVCTACADGYTKVAGSAAPKATASLVAADKCNKCASGYRQDVTGAVGTGTCAKCPDNQYIDEAVLSAVTFCTGCKKNNYQSTATLAVASATSTCAGCNGGVSTQAPFASTTSCSGCPLNSYQSAGASATWSAKHTCTACGAGFKSLAAQSGWVGTDLTAAKCLACVITTAGSCATGCPADHYQSAGHVGSCTEKGAAASPVTTVAADKTNCGAAAASGSVATGDAKTAQENCAAIVTSSAFDAVTTAACDWATATTGLALVKCEKCAVGKTLANKAVTDLQTASACTVPKAAAAASSGVVSKASVATAVAAALAAASVLA